MNPLSTSDLILSALTIILGASGTYLLLPHRHGRSKPSRVHAVGALLAALGVLAMVSFLKPPGDLLASTFFYAFALAAILGGILTVTSRNPIHSALWFAAVVLATTGLFLLAEAQFLAAGTVIVYAGAIIVTFLFVIMLAQAEGLANYDRMSRSPEQATFTSFLLLWGLLYALLAIKGSDRLGVPRAPLAVAASADASPDARVRAVYDRAVRPATARLRERPAGENGPPAPHVAGLGGTMFADHLVSVEVAGVLLFIALIGALAIVTPKPPVRPGDRPTTPAL